MCNRKPLNTVLEFATIRRVFMLLRLYILLQETTVERRASLLFSAKQILPVPLPVLLETAMSALLRMNLLSSTGIRIFCISYFEDLI